MAKEKFEVIKRKDFIDCIAKRNNLTKEQATNIIDSIFWLIKDSLEHGCKVPIHKFGTFSLKKVKAKGERKVFNFCANKEIIVPPKEEHYVAVFKFADGFKKGIVEMTNGETGRFRDYVQEYKDFVKEMEDFGVENE